MFFSTILKKIQAKHRRWESLCKQCGLCCYERELRGGTLYINYNAPCRYLDTETKRCRVYDHRFRVSTDCRKMTIFHAKFSRYLPETCGYVEHYRKGVRKKKR